MQTRENCICIETKIKDGMPIVTVTSRCISLDKVHGIEINFIFHIADVAWSHNNDTIITRGCQDRLACGLSRKVCHAIIGPW